LTRKIAVEAAEELHAKLLMGFGDDARTHHEGG
jgi:hypothetical protein